MTSDCVKFKQAVFHDDNWPQTLEEAIRLACSFAGAHRFDVQNLVDDDFSGDLSDWTVSDGTWNIVAGQLEGTGGGGDWQQIRHDNEAKPGFVCSFDYISGQGGFIFHGRDATDRAIVAFWTDAACGFAKVADNGAETILVDMPYGIDTAARVQVVARYSLDSIDEDRLWLEMGLFVDGILYVAHATDLHSTDWGYTGEHIGFAVKDTDTLTVDNVTVSMMHRTVEWVLIDPGQTAGSGMSRAIGSSRVSYSCRFDGTIRVWRPGNRDADWTAGTHSRTLRLEGKRNVGAPTHARVQAAIHEADSFDDDGNMERMHRFILQNDPNIMSESEAYDEARRVIHDNQERANVTRLMQVPNYLLEPNDRITVDGEDYRVVSISESLQMTTEGPRIMQTIEATKYLEFTP